MVTPLVFLLPASPSLGNDKTFCMAFTFSTNQNTTDCILQILTMHVADLNKGVRKLGHKLYLYKIHIYYSHKM